LFLALLSRRFYKHKGDSQFSAVAALGLVHLWNIDEGTNAVDVLTYATETEISAGALLATGIICCNCRSDTDQSLGVLSDPLDLSSDVPPLKRIAAAMGLGLSYCGTAREDVSEILSAIVADSEVGTELFSLAALSLGAVFVGTGNNSVAETICNALICERSDVQLRNTMTRFACLGLGLVFLGRQDCCEAILEACRAMPEVCRDYATMTVPSYILPVSISCHDLSDPCDRCERALMRAQVTWYTFRSSCTSVPSIAMLMPRKKMQFLLLLPVEVPLSVEVLLLLEALRIRELHPQQLEPLLISTLLGPGQLPLSLLLQLLMIAILVAPLSKLSQLLVSLSQFSVKKWAAKWRAAFSMECCRFVLSDDMRRIFICT
jgi:hypothetical protein